MIIHVVQKGETIESIAEIYGVEASGLIESNGLKKPDSLVVGECIVITYPEEVYAVQEGDSLESIAASHGITALQLLRNNPVLSGREHIYPGETLIISFGEKKRSITTNGYANPFISINILRKALPYLTYLSIFGYRMTESADIIEIDDTEIINMTKEFGVVPIMLLSTLTFQGIGSVEAAFQILYSDELVKRLIENILDILRRKGYYGVNMSFLYISQKNYKIYNDFAEKLKEKLVAEGYLVFISLSPINNIEADRISFQKINYSEIGEYADYVPLIHYNWGFNFGPPMPVSSITKLRQFLDYVLQFVPREKIIIGMPLIGYAWQLPFISGTTKANALTLDSALTLAREVGAVILFDEISQTPYYEFTDVTSGVPREFIVWFVDARSLTALMNLMQEYQLPGTGIWNIMSYSHQLWLIINSQYEIETLLPVSQG